MTGLLLAFSFLTILPLAPNAELAESDYGKAMGWFPLAGMVIGAMSAGVYALAGMVFSPLVATLLATITWIVLTGGLHLDGLADCCDGLLHASNPQRRLEIMKDSHLGSFASIGLALAVLAKFVLISQIAQSQAWLALPLATALGRWTLLPAATQPLARPGGLGALFAQGLTSSSWALASLLVLPLLVLAGLHGLAAALIALLVFLLVTSFAKRRIGGVTGDVFGLIIELTELAVLLVFCVRV